ncbi:MAG: hypothetical protein HKN01_11215 [Acidimicrobiia bacterium]|nr:hypothetical protein [Acidimicrobiia bacterium]
MNDQTLQTRLAYDSATLLAVIARIAPSAGLSPAETAVIDQVAVSYAASARRPSGRRRTE